MVDIDDDWMHPKPVSWEHKLESNPEKVEYLIERAKKQVCFGSPGYIIQWRCWSSYDTAVERDKEIERLLDEHPMWHLRRRDRHPYFEDRHIYPPVSHPGINEDQ